MVYDLRCRLRLADGRAPDPSGSHIGQPDGPIDADQRRAGRLRRRQAKAWIEGPSGRRYARSLARFAGDPGRCPGPRPGRPIGRSRASGHSCAGRACLCRSRLYRRSPGRGCSVPWNDLGGSQAAQAKRGFALLPRRWVVERSIAWMARFRRLARDYERLPETFAGLHYIAFACLMLSRLSDALNIVHNML